jgi:glycosyltransferase involved in cell wall biosynthesis
MHICLITNLPVWSLGKGKGAPSFYKTIKLYNDKGDRVTLVTTEQQLDLSELENVTVIQLPKYKIIQNKAFAGALRLVHKYLIYILNQFSGLRYLNKYAMSADVVYAYEIGFVPAVQVFCRKHKKPWVSRFQGTILTDLVQPSSWWRKLRLRAQFLDHIIALKAKSDLTIMTDDGTRGFDVLSSLRGLSISLGDNIFFWKNGVDLPEMESVGIRQYQKNHSDGDIIFCSVSRVQQWKRLDRSLDIFEEFNVVYPFSHYYIVGEGAKLAEIKTLVDTKGLSKNVSFMGSLEQRQIYKLLQDAKYFLSSYELSNLGNPLFEAICCEAIVATLNNGSTEEIIIDHQTGIISEEDNYLENAKKLIVLEDNLESQKKLRRSALSHLAAKMDTWDARMAKEYSQVIGIVNEP